MNLARIALALSVVTVALSVHLVARVWHPQRLFLVHLGRPLGDADRARSRRVVVVNLVACGVALLAILMAPTSALTAALAAIAPLVPIAFLLVELVALVRSLPKTRVPGRFSVPLDAPPGVTAYVSAPLQLLNLAVVASSFALFAWLVPRLPDIIPLHWNGQGQVNRSGHPGELWMIGGIQLFDTALCWMVAYGVSRERWALPTGDAERYAALQRRRRGLIVRLVEAMILGIDVGLGLGWLGVAAGSLPGHGGLITAAIVASAACTLVATIVPLALFLRPLARVQDELRSIAGTEVLGTKRDGWRLGGLVYYAPADPALFVPKRFGIGQTLNFARPGAWLLLGAIVVVPFLLTLIATRLFR